MQSLQKHRYATEEVEYLIALLMMKQDILIKLLIALWKKDVSTLFHKIPKSNNSSSHPPQ